MAHFIIVPQADYDTDPDDFSNAVLAFGVTSPATVAGLANGTSYYALEVVRSPVSAAFTPAAALTAPVNTAAPAVTPSGTQTTGTLLTSTDGTWTGNPTPTYAYQWQRDSVDISGETSATYTLAVADEGASITCDVTATNSQGSATATSNAVTGAAAAGGDTIRFPGGAAAPYLNGFGITGSTFNTEAEVILQDFTTTGQTITAADGGGTDYFAVIFQPDFDRFIFSGEAAGTGFVTASFSGFGWVAGEVLDLQISCNANAFTVSLTDGVNTASLTTTFTDITSLVSGIRVMMDNDNVNGFAADMDSLTINQTGATGGDTFTGTVAQWNAGNGSAPQFTMNGTVSAAP